ncbi:sensor histidine kinase [Reinekea sp. G2M2-21]|uniref:sensor histidine kinase n=1 Tax=Reinekea sp. G2M2-21 TaxID=2788942 RepID=UPI0018A9BFE1|nr:histidine kinase [Reinekea sp. G2M2-21]
MKNNSQQTDAFFIPNLCQTSSLLLLILISELCVLAWSLADQSFSWSQFGLRSISIQWIMLLSAAALCQLRRWLPNWSVRQGWIVCFVTIELIGISVVVVGGLVLQPDRLAPWPLLQAGLAIAIVAGMVLRYFQLLQLVIDQNQAEISSRMNALQARIKPHFLFNSLNTIAELIVTRPDAAEKSVESLSSLFRANLKETSSFCPLKQEIELVKGYLELEQWRLGDRLRIEWRESIHDEQWPVPILCLQPLVENAVVHGVASKTDGGRVVISALQTPRITTLTVENDIGPELGAHRGHGVGLDNVQRRLRVLYGEEARCRVEKTDEHFKVIVTLPKTPLETTA